MSKNHTSIDWLSATGSSHILIELLERDHYVSWFYKSEHNPYGVGSSRTVIKTRNILKTVGLIEEYTGEVRLRLYLRLTEKGRLVAEHLKAIQDLLTSP